MGKRKSMKGKGSDIFLDAGEEEEKASGEEKQGTDKSEDKSSSKEADQNRRKLEEGVDKEKAGFYLRKDLVTEMEMVWAQARALTDRKVTKSDIVNYALDNLIKDFKEDPEDNPLMEYIE